MNCNLKLHIELKKLGEIICPFCNEEIQVYEPEPEEPCCSNQELQTVNSYITCLNCGQVNGIEYQNEYIDFYANIYKIS